MKKILMQMALLLFCLFLLSGCSGFSVQDTSRAGTSDASTMSEPAVRTESSSLKVTEDGEYTGKDEVALYIHLYNHLPDNYITKTRAKKLGWVASEGNLQEVAPGKSIGGGKYGNYSKELPDGDYRECDIDSDGGFRSGKRLVYSTDGRIYYTEDHYKSFEQLY